MFSYVLKILKSWLSIRSNTVYIDLYPFLSKNEAFPLLSEFLGNVAHRRSPRKKYTASAQIRSAKKYCTVPRGYVPRVTLTYKNFDLIICSLWICQTLPYLRTNDELPNKLGRLNITFFFINLINYIDNFFTYIKIPHLTFVL